MSRFARPRAARASDRSRNGPATSRVFALRKTAPITPRNAIATSRTRAYCSVTWLECRGAETQGRSGAEETLQARVVADWLEVGFRGSIGARVVAGREC